MPPAYFYSDEAGNAYLAQEPRKEGHKVLEREAIPSPYSPEQEWKKDPSTGHDFSRLLSRSSFKNGAAPGHDLLLPQASKLGLKRSYSGMAKSNLAFSSTISKDNTSGECVRNASLLADFGRKRQRRTLHRFDVATTEIFHDSAGYYRPDDVLMRKDPSYGG